MAYNDNEGVWRTIKGRHVFIKDKKDLQKFIKEKGQEIESNREIVRNRLDKAFQGYREEDRLNNLRKSVNEKYTKEWPNGAKNPIYYVTKDLTPEESKYFEKVKGNNRSFSGERYDSISSGYYSTRLGDDISKAQDAQRALTVKEGERWATNTTSNGRTDLAKDFKDALNKSGLPESKRKTFEYRARKASAGNYKSRDERYNQIGLLKTDVDYYYRHNPVKIDEKDVKVLDTKVMDPALQNLQEASRYKKLAEKKTGPYGYEEIKNWKTKENPKTAKEVVMNIYKDESAGKNFDKYYAQSKVLYDTDDYVLVGTPRKDEQGKTYSYNLELTSRPDENGYIDRGGIRVEPEEIDEKTGKRTSWGGKKTGKIVAEVRSRNYHTSDLNTAKEVVNTMNRDIAHAEEISKIDLFKSFPEEKPYKLKTNNELVQSLIARGYRPETAEKMARKMINQRKRK